jgi:hypothetical protein
MRLAAVIHAARPRLQPVFSAIDPLRTSRSAIADVMPARNTSRKNSAPKKWPAGTF